MFQCFIYLETIWIFNEFNLTHYLTELPKLRFQVTKDLGKLFFKFT